MHFKLNFTLNTALLRSATTST